jgi:uncharacterized membrane protein YjjP (DUF1212 family)
MPRWGELQLEAREGETRLISVVAAEPTGVAMGRVAGAMRVVEKLCAGQLTYTAASGVISNISQAPPAPTWLFALAAAAGAVALGVIFGDQHLFSALLIVVSAAAGALFRRYLARFSSNVFMQPFCAAFLAGVIGALAVRYQLSSSLRLVAVCPCMVLVPGPPVLNGALDLARGRIHLGAARMIYAGLVTVAISTGLLLGLALLGVSLPVDQASRAVPLWFDTIAAGVAVAAFTVFFSMPLQMLAWPVAVGMLAHALRWWLAHAVRCHRLRLRGVNDSGSLSLQDGERPCATCRGFAYNIGAHQRDTRGWHDRFNDRFSDERRSHCSEVGD